jgi:hypothetical protein
LGQLHEIIADSLAIKAQGYRSVFIVKAAWVSLVPDIVPERSDGVLRGTDPLGQWIAQPHNPEVKVGPDKRKDHEQRNNLPDSGKRTVHMHGQSNINTTLLKERCQLIEWSRSPKSLNW